MRISIAQLNYKIGDFAGNKELIINAISKARNDRADLIVFSELCIPGYPPLDLLHRIDFIEKCILPQGRLLRNAEILLQLSAARHSIREARERNFTIQL